MLLIQKRGHAHVGDGRLIILFVHTQSQHVEHVTVKLRTTFPSSTLRSICGQPTQVYIILVATFRVGIFPPRWRISKFFRLNTKHVPRVGPKREEYPLKVRTLLGASVRVAGKLATIVKHAIVLLICPRNNFRLLCDFHHFSSDSCLFLSLLRNLFVISDLYADFRHLKSTIDRNY